MLIYNIFAVISAKYSKLIMLKYFVENISLTRPSYTIFDFFPPEMDRRPTSYKSRLPSTKPSGPSCVICFKTQAIFSIGTCDHPVCYECSTTMRVLCDQKECPICRRIMTKVKNTIYYKYLLSVLGITQLIY